MTPALETRRLILRPLALEDAEQVQHIFPQWTIVQHLNAIVPWPYPPDGVLTYYRDLAMPAIASNNEWHWTLRLKLAPEIIVGAIGLMRTLDPAVPMHNRGFWLDPTHHNQGLMTEAVIAANEYWFDVLGYPILSTGKATANIASRRISEKTGMRLVSTGESNYVCGRLPSENWEITREEWHTWRATHLRTDKTASKSQEIPSPGDAAHDSGHGGHR
ncbi:GNAT family N-acetyltransferase [Acidicapsa dinghuensis]|uniref:GNAT family N-acetyltransferase n=1 Tax=Acidicapsa dinghuensis TaxID=2218256 RepID=A0ABW1EKQ6_9BACT|nr:GNAT family N-acetyltransferase [Acidicapsa dinghuensis]